MVETYTDCRSENGITVGLIDAIITLCRIISKRDLTPFEVKEAITDMLNDEDVNSVLNSQTQGDTADNAG